jgi:lipid II:glycine glycyltransferase (peptidoglycan interpeptide bridge formation enzyme)
MTTDATKMTKAAGTPPATGMRVEIVTDRERWNRFVEARPTGNITQTYEWGELGHALQGGCLRLGAFDGDELRGAMLIVVEQAPLLRKPYFYVPRGPVVDDPSAPALSALCARAEEEARRHHAFMLKVEPNVPDGNAAWLTALSKLGFRRNPHATHPRRSWVLDIHGTEEQLLAGMKEKWRYNVKLAGRKGIKVREGHGDVDVDAFYQLYQDTAARDGIWIHPQEHYASFLKWYGERDAAVLLLAEFEGTPIAALIAATCGKVATYMFGASSSQQRNRMPNHLLQWTAIRWAKAHGCTTYDFRAIAEVLDPSEDMFSLYTYKQGFGGASFLALQTHDRPYSAPYYWAYTQALALKRARDRRRHAASLKEASRRPRAGGSQSANQDATASKGLNQDTADSEAGAAQAPSVSAQAAKHSGKSRQRGAAVEPEPTA